ncbi:MAG: 2Fe-2S iron-sulfur cluster-binding protein [Myxococcota bacterium]
MSKFEELKVVDVRRETSNAVSLSLAAPDLEEWRFEPGQYLTLRADIDGQDVRRPYSICAGVDEGVLRVGIKKVPGGLFSTFACEQIAVGHTLQVMPPQGKFSWSVAEAEGVHHVGFAAGSGITPILSIAKSVLSRRPDDRFTLFYGNKMTGEVMFLEELADLKDQFMERLRVVHLFSRETTDVELLQGRLDGAKVKELAQQGYFRPESLDVAYICGPGDMIDAVEAGLVELGVPAEHIRAERFTSAPGAEKTQARRDSEDENRMVEAILDGTHRMLTVLPEEDVVSAATRQGVEVPYSCVGGMCCTCRCRVVEGEVDMAVNYSLEPWELEAGFVLACQSRPKTERVVLDFDAQ